MKKTSGGWRKGCEPKVNCCCIGLDKPLTNECKVCSSKLVLGDTVDQVVTICANNIGDYGNIEPYTGCSALWEVMRHELLHLLSKCNPDYPIAGETPCDKCLCDEQRSYAQSLQCDTNSIWYKVGNYKDPTDCVIRSAATSCDGKDGCKGQSLESLIERSAKLIEDKVCTTISDLKIPSGRRAIN